MFIEAVARLKQSLQAPLVSCGPATHVAPLAPVKRSPITASRANAVAGDIERQGGAATAAKVIPPDVMLHARLGLRRRY